MTAIRLAWRLGRWEVGALLLASVGLTAAAVGFATSLTDAVAACPDPASEICNQLDTFGQVGGNPEQAARVLIGVLPFVGGLVLGVPLVARELEQRTAAIAWPLARSRSRWLVWRLAPVLTLATLALMPAAIGGQVLQAAMTPELSPLGFEGWGTRGPLLVVRLVPIVAIGLVCGALIGRTLPALLVGGALGIALFVGLGIAQRHWVAPVEPDRMLSPAGSLGTLFVEQRFRDADGRPIPQDEAMAILTIQPGEEEPDAYPESYELIIPADQANAVAAREGAALLIGAAALLVVTDRVVARRRPQ